LSIIAVLIAANTVVPFFLNVDYIIPMVILGFAVIGVSLVELAKLFGSLRDTVTTQTLEPQREEEMRTY
jgi:hypothetical protein